MEGWRGLPSAKPGEGYLYLSPKQQETSTSMSEERKKGVKGKEKKKIKCRKTRAPLHLRHGIDQKWSILIRQ